MIDVYQNLWKINNNTINVVKYAPTTNQFDSAMKDLNNHDNKPFIEIGYNFIDTCLGLKQNVLVHCMAGISRSVSLVVYYLMKKYHLSYKEAHSFVKSKRSIANPNESFQLQLKRYEIMREKMADEHATEIIESIKQMNRRR